MDAASGHVCVGMCAGMCMCVCVCRAVRQKSHKEIQSEIAAILRQITASVSFLPLLDEPCTFDLLVYTDEGAGVPNAWEDSDPRYIPGAEEVKLRSFTTTIHKVRTERGMCAGGRMCEAAVRARTVAGAPRAGRAGGLVQGNGRCLSTYARCTRA